MPNRAMGPYGPYPLRKEKMRGAQRGIEEGKNRGSISDKAWYRQVKIRDCCRA